ncbi:hypothetical protein N8878_00210 [Psychromonas sp.]|nr:hypothetical protein [Psychromonas sp.]
MRPSILLTLITSLTLISGCQDTTKTDNCSYYVQQDLDNENFDTAISKLNTQACQDSYSNNEYLVDLATAYLGKSGYSIPDMINVLLENSDGDDGFDEFTTQIGAIKNDDSFYTLKTTLQYFDEFLGDSCVNIDDKTTTETGICLIIGMVDITRAALAVDYLSDGEEWENGDSEAMQRSTCALQYTVAYTVDNSTAPVFACDDSVSVDSSESVTFSNSSGINKIYENLTVTSPTGTEYFLQAITADTDTGTNTSNIVFTQNYCTTDFTSCDDVSESTCYVCPSENEDDLSVNEFVLDALNDGFSNIEQIFIEDGTNDSDIQQAINDFKTEINADGCDTDSEEPCFTMDDIISYLNNNN